MIEKKVVNKKRIMDSVTTLLLIWLGVTLAVLGMSFVNMLGLSRVVDHLRLSNPDQWSEDKFESFMSLASQNLTMLLFVTVFVVEVLSLLFVDVRTWLSDHAVLGGIVYGVPLLAVTGVWIIGKLQSPSAAGDEETEAGDEAGDEEAPADDEEAAE